MSSAESVANAFLDLARRDEKFLTNMQLQKLVYIAHGYSLAKLRQPLFYNNIHAFKFGPVIPNLYKTLKQYGASEITNYIPTLELPISDDSSKMEIIREVWHDYKDFSGFELSDLTHRVGTPWSETWRTNPFGVIPDELIADYYRRDLYERFANQP